MKILFFIDSLRAGGKERRLTELIKVLNSYDDFVCEIAVMGRNVHYSELFENNINIHYFIRTRKKDPSIFISIFQFLKQNKPDIVHCWDSMTMIYAIPACKILNIKIINGCIVNAPLNTSFLSKTIFRARITFPFSDAIVGNSKAGLKAYKSPTGKSQCIYNGFNFDRLKSISDPSDIKANLGILNGYVIGMVASYSEHKDYRTYLKAAQILLHSRRDLTFLAIGDDTDSDEIKEMVPDEIKNHFRFTGNITNIESYVNAMDICVLCTYTEGISNSIMEYMALGKPVIASSGGGTNEIVTDGLTGFLIPQSDPEKLEEKIDFLLDHPEVREEMGKQGKSIINQSFSIDRMVDQYTNLYRNLITLHTQNN